MVGYSNFIQNINKNYKRKQQQYNYNQYAPVVQSACLLHSALVLKFAKKK